MMMMKNFIVYNRHTGQILRTGNCPSDMLSIQANTCYEEVLEGVANDQTEKIKNSKVVSKSQYELDIIENAKKTNSKREVTERLILKKMNSILRQMAIDELRKEGKLE